LVKHIMQLLYYIAVVIIESFYIRPTSLYVNIQKFLFKSACT
jgi:hypothetical protein